MCPAVTPATLLPRRTFCYMTVLLSGAGLVLLRQAVHPGTALDSSGIGVAKQFWTASGTRPSLAGTVKNKSAVTGRMDMAAPGTNKVRRLDSHLHVWAPKGSQEYPFYGPTIGAPPGDEQLIPGHLEVLLPNMQAAGVEGALIVQPGNHLYDHSYVASVLRKHPDKFVGCALVNPTLEAASAAAEVERLALQDGFRALRFNPYLWPDGRRMSDEVGHAVFAKCEELGLVASFMTFKGLLLHIEDIRQLAKAHPKVPIVLDHAAFVKSKSPGSDEWQELLSLATFPQVYVKLSAFFRLSTDPYPFMDARLLISDLISAYGAERLMWGTDFPWVNSQYGYLKAWEIIQNGDELAGESLLSERQTQLVMGETLRALFPGGWT